MASLKLFSLFIFRDWVFCGPYVAVLITTNNREHPRSILSCVLTMATACLLLLLPMLISITLSTKLGRCLFLLSCSAFHVQISVWKIYSRSRARMKKNFRFRLSTSISINFDIHRIKNPHQQTIEQRSQQKEGMVAEPSSNSHLILSSFIICLEPYLQGRHWTLHVQDFFNVL